MPNYRRLRVPGGTYFFTVTLNDRRSDLLIRHIDLLRHSFAKVRDKRPFETLAMVILPDHFHALWRLPPNDDGYSVRIRLLKEGFTKALPDATPGRRPGERGIWQRRFWEHLIRDPDDFDAHVDYIHNNPVKHGLVAHPDDWPYSTWHDWKRDHGRPANKPLEDWHPHHLGEP